MSSSSAEILDVCCGGRMWWWDKEHPLAVYIDKREAPAGKRKWLAWRLEMGFRAEEIFTQALRQIDGQVAT